MPRKLSTTLAARYLDPAGAESRKRNLARQVAHNAIARGLLPYKVPYCEGCMVGSRLTKMHIADYDKPLEIKWLCVVCYREADEKRDGVWEETYSKTAKFARLSDAQKREHARGAIAYALERGRLEKPDKCTHCKQSFPCPPYSPNYFQAHHPNYYKPLEVVWLCAGCHSAEHVRMREKGINPYAEPD